MRYFTFIHRSNLVVRPNVLSGGSSYTFRLSAMDTLSLTTGESYRDAACSLLCLLWLIQKLFTIQPDKEFVTIDTSYLCRGALFRP